MDARSSLFERFVVLEGIDGAGTTTQMKLLAERLAKARVSAWLTSEPTDRPTGIVAREVLSGRLEVAPETVAYVFAADRSDHLFHPDGIVAHLERGDLVVCDRYVYSSLAYQTIDADPQLVASLNERFPDAALVLFLDLPVAAVEERLAARPQREIYEHLAFQERVRERYLSVLDEASLRTAVKVIDATLPPSEVSGKIWQVLEERSIL